MKIKLVKQDGTHATITLTEPITVICDEIENSIVTSRAAHWFTSKGFYEGWSRAVNPGFITEGASMKLKLVTDGGDHITITLKGPLHLHDRPGIRSQSVIHDKGTGWLHEFTPEGFAHGKGRFLFSLHDGGDMLTSTANGWKKVPRSQCVGAVNLGTGRVLALVKKPRR